MRCLLLIALIISAMQMGGCGKPQEIPGGTPGVIRIDGKGIAEVQVTAYRRNLDQSYEQVAIAVSRRNGEFELRKHGHWKLFGSNLESIGSLSNPSVKSISLGLPNLEVRRRHPYVRLGPIRTSRN